MSVLPAIVFDPVPPGEKLPRKDAKRRWCAARCR